MVKFRLKIYWIIIIIVFTFKVNHGWILQRKVRNIHSMQQAQISNILIHSSIGKRGLRPYFLFETLRGFHRKTEENIIINEHLALFRVHRVCR